MATRSVALKVAHHTSFLAWPSPGQLCGICGVGVHDFLCERCGAPMHFDCYWLAVASEAERQGVANAVAEVNALREQEFEEFEDNALREQEFEVPVRLETCPGDDYLEHLGSLCRGCRS